MRKAYGFKLQSQKNVIKMWGIHLHIMLLARRYRRMFGKDVSAYNLKKQVVLLDIPPLTDEALTEIADALFVEHDKTEAEDAETKLRGSLAR